MAGTATFINGIIGSPDTPATFPAARFDDTITRGDFDNNVIRNCGSAGALEFNILGTHYVTNCTFTGNTLDLLFTQPSGTVTLELVNSTSSPTTPTTSDSIAWQVNEITEHDVNVKESDGTAILAATVYAENDGGTEEFNVETDASGDITTQDVIRRDIEHTSGLPKGAGTVTTHTPFLFRIRKYGFISFEDTALTYTNLAQVNNTRLTTDSVVVASEATAAAYTGIAVVGGGTQTITLTESHSILEVYEYVKDWEADGALGIDEATVMTSASGTIFTLATNWDFIINSGGTLTGTSGQELVHTGTGELTLSGTGDTEIVVENGNGDRRVFSLINVKDNDGVNLQSARVYLAAEDGAGDLPFGAAVTSITRASTTATVTQTSHGLETGEFVNLNGITDKEEDNSGAFQVTVTGSNTYTYTTTDSGSTNYTGTITATGVVIHGVTDSNGDITSSRTLTGDQNITGYVRKSSPGSTRFKTFRLSGSVISQATGFTINVRLVPDE